MVEKYLHKFEKIKFRKIVVDFCQNSIFNQIKKLVWNCMANSVYIEHTEKNVILLGSFVSK